MLTQTNQTTSLDFAEIISRLFSNCQEKEMRHASKFGVSIVEFRCLRALYDKNGITVNELAQKMSLTSSRVTRIIDNLVSKKLVTREIGTRDRRIYNLHLTAKGESLAGELIDHYREIHGQILKSIPSDEREKMITSLYRLNNAVEKWLIDK
ncbi:MarR family transcriptional regulator [candidate division KSB1 bacterium]|nr:MarR family transcriptional regulator [candidate division KSB1 bacterium]